MSEPRQGLCSRCKQHRHLFRYKPLHSCVKDAGLVSLQEAVELIDEIRGFDPWCEAELDRMPQPEVCVSCFQSLTEEEQEYMELNQLEKI